MPSAAANQQQNNNNNNHRSTSAINNNNLNASNAKAMKHLPGTPAMLDNRNNIGKSHASDSVTNTGVSSGGSAAGTTTTTTITIATAGGRPITSSKDSNKMGSVTTANMSKNTNNGNETIGAAATVQVGDIEPKCQRAAAIAAAAAAAAAAAPAAAAATAAVPPKSPNLSASSEAVTQKAGPRENAIPPTNPANAKAQSTTKIIGEVASLGTMALAKEAAGVSANNGSNNNNNNNHHQQQQQQQQQQDAANPIKLIFTTIEHKIRNLEKRKTKLESYRSIQMSGKDLSADQRTAVSKYDAVISTLDFARDLVKQLQQFIKDSEKEQRKQARKDLIARTQAETDKIREVLIIQNIMSCLTDNSVRADFLNGDNGAIKIQSTDMEILDKFCMDVQTRRPETVSDMPFVTAAQKAAELFSMTIDGRQKQYHDTTYENVRKIFQRIQESDFLDKIYLNDASIMDDRTDDDNISKDGNIERVNVINENMQNENVVAAGGDACDKAILNTSAVSLQKTFDDSFVNKNQLLGRVEKGGSMHNIMANVEKLSLHAQPNIGQPVSITVLCNDTTKVSAMHETSPSVSTSSMHQVANLSIIVPPHGNFMVDVNNLVADQNASGQVACGGDMKLNQQMLQIPQANNNVAYTNTTVGVGGDAGSVLPGNLSHNTGNPLAGPEPSSVGFNPPTVHAVEQTFFNQHSRKQKDQQQFAQQMHSLSEVLSGGNFYFLQDSELDVVDVNNPHSPNLPNFPIFEPLQISTIPANEADNKGNSKAQKTGPQIMPTQNNPNAGEADGAGIGDGNGINQNNALLQQQLIHMQEQQQPLISNHIHTQTFTNQSFPQVTPSQSSLGSNGASPLYHQKAPMDSHPLFSPISHGIQSPFQQNAATPSQLIIGTEQQPQPQQQQPMINMSQMNSAAGGATQNPNNIFKGQAPIVSHQLDQRQKTYQQQLNTDMPQTNARFPFDSSVVGAYEQQLQQLASSNTLKSSEAGAIIIPDSGEIKMVKENVVGKSNTDLLTEWCDTKQTNATNTPMGVHNVILDAKPTAALLDANKWSELDASSVNSNTTSHINVVPPNNVMRKNEWASPNVSTALTSDSSNGGYPVDVHADPNHWTQHNVINYSRVATDARMSATAVAAAAAAAAAACGASNGSPYPRRNDDRRLGGVNLNNYRPNSRPNYNPQVQQQNTNAMRNNVGSAGGNNGNAALTNMYFRNDGTNSYYQNGGTATTIGLVNNSPLINAGHMAAAGISGGNGGGGGNHMYANNRNQRSGCGVTGANSNINNARNNGGPSRNIGFNRGSVGGGTHAAAMNTNSALANSNYMNSRQTSRLSMTMENKN